MSHGRTPEEVEAHEIARELTYEKFDSMISQEAKDFYAEVLAEALEELGYEDLTAAETTDPEDDPEDLPDDEDELEEMVEDGEIG